MSELRAERIAAGYGARRVLRTVDLVAKSGEFLALIGPNGAGKTTLLRVLARQLRPTAGTVSLDGVSIWEQSSNWTARRIALARSGRSGDRPVTVLESVSLGRAPHRGWLLPLVDADRDAVNVALALAGLDGFADRPVTELSDGESQRVALARALAQEPRVLLVDEPTAHLDLRYQAEVLDRLMELAESGMIVVAALHDLNLAARWADRIALLSNGELAAVGSPVEVLTPERLAAVYGAPVTVTADPNGGVTVMPIRHGVRP